MRLEGKPLEPLQRHARALLKAARISKQHYERLAQAHLTLAAESDVNNSGPGGPPQSRESGRLPEPSNLRLSPRILV